MRHISYIPKRGIRRRRVSGLEQVSATRGQTGFAARIGLWAEDMAPVRLSHCDGGSDRRRGLRATAEAQYRDWALSESDSQTLHLLVGVVPSMGSVGDCFDNAMAESFFATLECELIDRSVFRTQAEARMAVFEYIEGWYNPRRRHSGLGYLSPLNFERSNQQAA